MVYIWFNYMLNLMNGANQPLFKFVAMKILFELFSLVVFVIHQTKINIEINITGIPHKHIIKRYTIKLELL